MTEAACGHIAAISTVKHAKRRECDECVKIGSDWVHLRTCQECGGTHCCDNASTRGRAVIPSWPRPNPASAGSIVFRTTRSRSTERCHRICSLGSRSGVPGYP